MSKEKEENEESTQEFKLDNEMELRFEVSAKSQVSLQLKSGFVEYFGTELVKNKQYVFTAGAKIAVFTWHGCTLELTGKTEVAYVAKQTSMNIYVNIHATLEQMRRKAEQENSKGPTVLVVGPTDVGKSTLCRILLNHAVRQGRKPIFVDLDVGQGQISVPGTIGALLVEKPADVEEGFSQKSPLVYHFGHKTPGNNTVLYNMLVSRLSEVIGNRAESNRKAGISGVIINSCGWVKGDGYRSIIHATTAFEVDVVLVIDQERLYNELDRDLSKSVKVTLVPKSDGVVKRSQAIRAEARDNRVREYFYGLRTSLHPHSFEVKFSDIKVYKIGGLLLPDFFMPLVTKAEDNRTKLVPVQIGQNLLHHVLSVSFAASIEEDIVKMNVAGFICVTEVYTDKQMLTVLSPQPPPLPSTILLMGDVQFMDAH